MISFVQLKRNKGSTLKKSENKRINNGRRLAYDIKISRKISSKTSGWDYKDKTVLNVVIANILACIRKGSKLIYSRSTGNVIESKKRVTSRKVIRAIEYLEGMGLIYHKLGKGSLVPRLREVSWVMPTKELKDIFPDDTLHLECEKYHLESVDVLGVKNTHNGYRAPKPTTKYEGLMNTLREINRINEFADIRSWSGEVLSNIIILLFDDNVCEKFEVHQTDIYYLDKIEESLAVTVNGSQVYKVCYKDTQAQELLSSFSYESGSETLLINILDHMKCENLPCLPIVGGFIVPRHSIRDLVDVMGRSLECINGSVGQVKLDIIYLEAGELVTHNVEV